MVDTPNRLMDEFARLMTDAAGAAQGVRREIDTLVQSQMERLLNNMDLVKAQFERMLRDMDVVSRDEFEAVKAMAIAARDENEKLAARIAELESKHHRS